MKKDKDSSLPKRSGAVDNVASVFTARRDLRPATKAIVKGTGLSVEEADILVYLYGIRKLGWPHPNYDGYVNYTILKKLLVHDPSLFTRRIDNLLRNHLVHVRPSTDADPALHGKAQQVRIEAAGIKAVTPVWESYCRFSEELLEGFTKDDLDAHFKVNAAISLEMRKRRDPDKQLLRSSGGQTGR